MTDLVDTEKLLELFEVQPGRHKGQVIRVEFVNRGKWKAAHASCCSDLFLRPGVAISNYLPVQPGGGKFALFAQDDDVVDTLMGLSEGTRVAARVRLLHGVHEEIDFGRVSEVTNRTGLLVTLIENVESD